MEKKSLSTGSFFHPLWYLAAVTLPHIILFFIIYAAFSVFSSTLSENQMGLWIRFAWIFGTSITIYFLYGVWLLIRKRPIHPLVSPLLFLTYIPLVFFYFVYFHDLGIHSLPDWIIPSFDLAFLYPGTFLMPSFIYALAIGILTLTPTTKKNRPLLNFLVAVLIPLCWYGFFTLILPLFRNIYVNISEHVIVILMISSTIAFFFLLFRALVMLLRLDRFTALKYSYVWRIIFSLVLPLAGLIVYQFLLPKLDFVIHREAYELIGNFSHPMFITLAAFTGLMLSFPDLSVNSARMFLFFMRMLCLPFSLYFCLVFLTFLPLSLVAVLICGVGLLMLAPYLLIIIQTKVLINDYNFLTKRYSQPLITSLIIASLLVLPGAVSFNSYLDRVTLHNALEYSFEEQRTIDINRSRLESVLDLLQSRKDKIPFITPFYDWMVLDGMALSHSKISKLEKVFFNEGPGISPKKKEVTGDKSVIIQKLQSKTTLDEGTGTFRSQINLKLKNQNGFIAEFATSFDLPKGTWISDYYLVVENEKVHGLLMVKKAALWIYNRIKAQRRDPGLIYYLDGNRVVLRVFPLAKGEVRKTGFELIHKEPIEISIGSHQVKLGYWGKNHSRLKRANSTIVSFDKRAIYVSREGKEALPLVSRKPSYHFILDSSESCDLHQTDYRNRIKAFVREYRVNTQTAKVTLAGYTHKTYEWQDYWQKEEAPVFCEGGFFLDKAIKSIVIDQQESTLLTYPVIVVISNNLSNAILPNFLDQYSFAIPETDHYYELTEEGSLTAHPLFANAYQKNTGRLPRKVRVWPNLSEPKVFLADDGKASVALLPKDSKLIHFDESKNQWLKGLTLWSKTKQQLFESESKEDWTKLVALSKQYRVLNPFTAFTVLESQVQWEVLLKKEKTALNGKKSMDMESGQRSFRRMPEPPFFIVIICLMVIVLAKNRFNTQEF